MKRRTKYYLISLLALMIFIFGYHFYAAYQAEQQIGEAIREQIDKNTSATSVTYSSIDVSPFSGDIRFSDLAIINSASILRSQSIRFDMDYRDFLNIYIWNLKRGLEHLSHVRVNADQSSFVNRLSFREIKFDFISIIFQGNAWDVLVSLVNATPIEAQQSITLDGEAFTYHIPGSLPGTIKAETFGSEHLFPAKSGVWWEQGEHRLKLNEIVWTPPVSFQEQYGFFIKGFGYDTEHIPADSLQIALTLSSISTDSISLDLFTELFDAQVNSLFLIDHNSFANSRLRNGTVRVNNTSEQFETFISNLEQLLGRKLSSQSRQILWLSGPLNDLRFSIQQ